MVHSLVAESAISVDKDDDSCSLSEIQQFRMEYRNGAESNDSDDGREHHNRQEGLGEAGSVGDGGGDGDGDGDDDDDDDGHDGPNGDDDSDSSVDSIEDIHNYDDPDDPDDPEPDDGDPGENLDDDSTTDEEEENGLVNFNFHNLGLNAVCRSVINCTVREVTALLLALGSKHRMTYDAIIGMMTCFNTLYGRKYLPVDKKVLWRLLGRREVGITKYVYCHNCLRGHGLLRHFPDERLCEGCQTVIRKRFCKVYIKLNLQQQIQNLFRKQKVRNALHYREERELRVPGAMEDILDGTQYRHLREEGNVLAYLFNYSFTFNLDGFRLAKSSTAEAWPIYVKWNELPPKMRQKYMLLAGIWVDLQHPNMNLYLEPFVEQANHLSNVGVSWQPYGQLEEIRSKFVPTCCVVDAQARCSILNLNSPAGYCGCPFCDHRGLYVGGAVHFPYLPPVPVPLRRTHEEIRRCMIAGAANGGRGEGHVLGFKGASQLMLMDHFHLSKGVVTDDMHPFAGVIKHHTEILMTRTVNHRPAYYIGDSIDRIDSRLLTIRTPTHISRKPRSLKRRKKWQSSEWRNWLLYYIIPCMEGILPRIYLTHLQLLAQAIFLISKDVVTDEDCNEAERLFHRYVELFERYFGPENMRYNIHILLHATDCVREWGPMPGQSTSFYEEWNHTLMQTVTSPNARADQIVTRYLMKRFLDNVEDDDGISERVKRKVYIILEDPRLRQNVTVGGITLLGKCFRRAPNERERQLFQRQDQYPDEIIVYKRALLGRIEYRSADYRYAGEETKSDDSHVFTWHDEFAQIITIALVGERDDRRIVLFLNILNTNAHVNRYVCRVAAGEEVVIMDTFQSIRSHAIYCNTPAGSVVMPVSNAWEID